MPLIYEFVFWCLVGSSIGVIGTLIYQRHKLPSLWRAMDVARTSEQPTCVFLDVHCEVNCLDVPGPIQIDDRLWFGPAHHDLIQHHNVTLHDVTIRGTA